MRFRVYIGVVLLPATLAFAESAKPIKAQPVAAGRSRPVWEIQPSHGQKSGRLREFPVGRSRRGRPEVPGSIDPVVQAFMPAGVAAMPAPMLTFEGISNADNENEYSVPIQPPDTNGDIGPDHYVHAVNRLFQVFDRDGNPVTAALPLSDLFTGCDCLCDGLGSGDVIVLYDPLADRWLISEIAFDIGIDPETLSAVPAPPFHQCIAISTTGDPSGDYYIYDFAIPGDWLNDYPKFGVWPDAYYMTDNQYNVSKEIPHGTGMFAFDRVKMLAGDPSAGLIYFDLEDVDGAIDGMLPADLDGPPPPAGAPNYFMAFMADEYGDPQGDALRIFEFHADFARPHLATITERPESPLTVAAFDPQLFCAVSERDCIPQPVPADSASYLDALSDRLMHRLQYRNFGGHESLVVNHTVDVGSNHAGIRYYELRRTLPAGVFTVHEQASYAPDAHHRWMGSAAMDWQGNLAVGYSVSSTNLFPAIRYAGRLASDLPGGLFQGETTLQAGGGAQTGTDSRWGDYSMLAVDPTDECTVWYTQQYYAASGDQDWQTKVGTFKFTGATAAPKGTLQGAVTDAVSGLPISNAVVRTANGFVRTTDGAGGYSMTLPPGSYDVTASEKVHESVTVSGVVVSNAAVTTQNFILDRVPVLELVMTAFADSGGNSAVDVNECIALTLTLQNNGAAAASNIVAQLASVTPAVAVAEALTTYPDLPVGNSAGNNQTLRVSVAPGFTCGAPVELLLTVTHNGGTNFVPVALASGSGVGTATRFDSADTPVEVLFLLGGASQITVSNFVGSVAKVTVSLYLTYSDDGELEMNLLAPDGTTVPLSVSNGSGGEDFGTACDPDSSRTTFDDAAGTPISAGSPPFVGTFRPDGVLSNFIGLTGATVNGNWTLQMAGFFGTGSLECWSLFVSGPSCADSGGGCSVTDTDGDGLPDWWEQFYFGGATTAVAGADDDGDGETNAEEFTAGTHPKAAGSVLRVVSVTLDEVGAVIRFPTVLGKSYRVEYAPDLPAGLWTELPTVVAGSGLIEQVTDSDAAVESSRFYRVKIVP